MLLLIHTHQAPGVFLGLVLIFLRLYYVLFDTFIFVVREQEKKSPVNLVYFHGRFNG